MDDDRLQPVRHARGPRVRPPRAEGALGPGPAPAVPAPVAVPTRRARYGLTREVAVLGLALLAYATGMASLVATYADRAGYLRFWVSILLGLVGVCLAGLATKGRHGVHLAALAGLGILLYAPYLLRSPQRLLFTDELFHEQIMRQVLATGTTAIDPTFYPIPGDFPGLELVAIAIHGATGVSELTAIRITTALCHVLIPILAYLVGVGIGLRPQLAFLCGVVYCANTSFGFFHSTFSYETLGIVLFLGMWALMAAPSQWPRPRTEVLLGVVLVAGVTVTHHVSSYLLAATVLVVWIASLLYGRGRLERLGMLAAAAILLPVAWLGEGSVRAREYLENTLGSRVDAVVGILSPTQGETGRPRAGGSGLPALEQIGSRLYIPLVFGLIACGLIAAWRAGSFRRRGPGPEAQRPVLLALAVVGPLGWLATIPAVFTSSADVAYRSWPFLFLGIAIYLCLGLEFVRRRVLRRRPGTSLLWATPLVCALVAGGLSIGDNQAGRFPTDEPQRAAGPEAATADVVDAAQWIRSRGLYERVVGDQQAQVMFAVYGDQRAPGWGAWIPFLARDPRDVSRYLDQTDTRYVVVDRRIADRPPRYTGYFGKAELYGRGSVDYGAGGVFPVALLDKFDGVPNLGLIYDGGNIRIYDAEPVAAADGPEAG